MSEELLDITWPELGNGEDVTVQWEEGPCEKSARLLDRALEKVEAVPYRVTLRWLFYELFQEGWFNGQKPSKTRSDMSAKKMAYCNFIKLFSRLRHSSDDLQERWPIELADDRRDPVHRTQLFESTQEWLETYAEKLSCNVDKMMGQNQYVMVAFEAEAMQSQFEYETASYGVSLWPFSGAASIPYKKRLAEYIENLDAYFDMPVVILYFGDYDKAGLAIPESAFRHVRKWCDVDFSAYRVGLNLEHIEKYHIQDDPDRPGKYQWEAVNKQAAHEIITGALDSLLHREEILEIERQEAVVTRKARQALSEITADDDESEDE